MDTSPEARMVIKNLLLSTEQGLGYGETPIFPIGVLEINSPTMTPATTLAPVDNTLAAASILSPRG